MKKTQFFKIVSILIVLSCVSIPARGSIMAYWDFGNNAADYSVAVTVSDILGTPDLMVAGGEVDPDGKDGTAYGANPGGQAAAWDDVKVTGDDAYWIMSINTTGWSDMAIRWDYKAWDELQGYSFDLDYRIGDSGDWINIVNNNLVEGFADWYSFSQSLAGISAINNQTLVQFRMNDLDNSGNGKFAVDNVELSGVPEPASMLLLALGGLAIRSRRN